jgi:hypothetical protein
VTRRSLFSRVVRLSPPSGAALAIAALLGGCQPRPELATTAVQPRTAPVRNIGSFNEALRCMDDMFLAQGKKDIYITTAGIPDATGLIAAGTKEMFISAVSKMSAKSGAFRFVDYDPTQTDVQILSEIVGLREDFVAPSYYVRGAITQLDSGVLSSSESGGLSLPSLDLAVSRDQVVSVVSMDLNVGKLVTRQILPGISAANSIAVVQAGKGADLGGLIGKAGLSFNVSINRSEGFSQAVRNLVELSTIEILGKLTRVPYWECLSIEPTNPTFKAEARDWFDTMNLDEREEFARMALIRAGYLDLGDAVNPAADLTNAVARYQADNDLVPSGRLDFDLYYRLLATDARQRGPGPAAPAPVTAALATVSAARELPRVILSTSRGPQPAYRVGEMTTVRIQPTEDAYVYCYYQDSNSKVSRIFPNRFQPDALVLARALLEVPPGGGNSFFIEFDKVGGEIIACLASNLEVGLNLPEALKAQDLEPLPVSNIDDVVTAFRAIGGPRINEARMTIEVTR